MRLHRILYLAFGVLVGAGSSVLGGLSAARGDTVGTVVATVGDSPIESSQLLTRIRHLSEAQLTRFGATPSEQRRTVLQQVIAPEVAEEQEAKLLGIVREPGVDRKIQGVLRDALVMKLEATAQASITQAELEQRLVDYQARFSAPAGIRLWRILVATEGEAERILKENTGPQAVAHWSEEARKNSLDRATNMRRGELGIVYPDGRTQAPTVRVDPALYAAANQVKDGELVPKPVKEGERYAAVWRRGSLPAQSFTLKDTEPTLRLLLTREKVARALSALVAELRTKASTHVDPAALELLPPAPPRSVQEFARKPPTISSAAGSPIPSVTPLGLR